MRHCWLMRMLQNPLRLPESGSRRLAELVDGNDPVKLTESHERPWLNIAREFPGVFAMKDFGGFLTDEVLDHLR